MSEVAWRLHAKAHERRRRIVTALNPKKRLRMAAGLSDVCHFLRSHQNSFAESILMVQSLVSNTLNKNKIPHLNIGGFAVAYHGYPRATEDIDLLTANSKEIVMRLRKALESAGLVPKEYYKMESSFFDCESTEPSIPIEIMHINARAFLSMWRRKKTLKFRNTTFHIISFEDLIELKKQSKRPKDLHDIEELMKRRRENQKI